MARPETDRNLLGILALQMDFIAPRPPVRRHARLGPATKRKPSRRSSSPREALSPQTTRLLEPMVARHIQMHGGDPDTSLAALTHGAGGARR